MTTTDALTVRALADFYDHDNRDLVYRTLETLSLFATRSGHLSQRVTNESRGNCLPPGHCTPQCRQFREVLTEYIDRLEALDAARPVQLALDEVAG